MGKDASKPMDKREAVRRLREWYKGAKDVSHDEAALRLGISPQTLTNWIEGKSKPVWGNLARIQAFLESGGKKVVGQKRKRRRRRGNKTTEQKPGNSGIARSPVVRPGDAAHVHDTTQMAYDLTLQLLGIVRRVTREEIEAALAKLQDDGRLVTREQLSNGLVEDAVRRALSGIAGDSNEDEDDDE